MPPYVLFLSSTLPPFALFLPHHRFCPLLLLTLFPIAKNVYDAPLGFRSENPVDVPTCILDKMLRAFTYIILRRMWSDWIYIYRDTGIKWIKLTSQKWRMLFMQQVVFRSRVKPRGHCVRYRDIYSRFLLFRIDISANPAWRRDFK